MKHNKINSRSIKLECSPLIFNIMEQESLTYVPYTIGSKVLLRLGKISVITQLTKNDCVSHKKQTRPIVAKFLENSVETFSHI